MVDTFGVKTARRYNTALYLSITKLANVYRSLISYATDFESRCESYPPGGPNHPTGWTYVSLAQLVEHLICNEGVTGSNPAGGTHL